MRVLSVFDGMSCGQIALNRAGVKYDTYFASDIDGHAIQVTQKNYPGTIQLGDVTKVSGLGHIDLLMGGSPCQGFSFAGKQLNFSDPRSALFFEYIRLLNELRVVNPGIKFLLENVNMKKEYLRVISDHLGVLPVRINSRLVSAQNRDRWYWTNIRTRSDGLFGDVHSDIPQPEDRGILLRDVLQSENEIDDKYYLNGTNSLFGGMDIDDKGKTLRQRSLSTKHNYDIINIAQGVVNQNGSLRGIEKSSCLDANYYKGLDNHSQRTAVCVAMRGRNPEKPGDRRAGIHTEQRLEHKTDGKTNCLTSVGKDNLILQRSHGFNRGGVFKEKSPTILSNSWEHNNHVLRLRRLRRLTPIECERLQTVPDNYTAGVSDTQRYKMLGNGWTVDVIAHILKFLDIDHLGCKL